MNNGRHMDRSCVNTLKKSSRPRPLFSQPSCSYLQESRQTKNNQNSGKIGLKNHGNTCFMNSIVQCLSHTTELRDFCLTSKYKKYINKSSKMRGNLFEAFAEVIDKLWNSNSNVVVLLSLKSQVQKYSSKFTGYDQHDSQEFFHYLLEGLHEDINKAQPSKKNPIPDNPAWSEEKRSEETWNWYRTYDNSFIIDKFVGQLKSSLTCSVCNHVSTIFDPYWDLSLPISKKSRYSSTESIDIMQCLEDFTKEETLDGNECPTCEKCNKRRKMTKKFTIHFLPDILVLHLKRFNEGTSYRQKLSTNVSFPQCLTFNKSSIATPQSTYQLYAVSNHSGSCYGGHYTAYCKHADSGDWYQYNDSHVSQVSSSSVQSKEAYVLFYEKIQRRRSSNSSRQSSTKIIRSNY